MPKCRKHLLSEKVDDKMPSLIRGQKISRAKFEMSKGLRQQMTPEEHEETGSMDYISGGNK
jgi:hypothetical protein